jgi:predicted CopG family antitoxin
MHLTWSIQIGVNSGCNSFSDVYAHLCSTGKKMLEFLSLAMDSMHDDELLKLSGNGFAAAIMYSSGTARSFHHIFSKKSCGCYLCLAAAPDV